ncbi:MAG: hypothetical protein AB8H12_02430 [Lewinella sp.]
MLLRLVERIEKALVVRPTFIRLRQAKRIGRTTTQAIMCRLTDRFYLMQSIKTPSDVGYSVFHRELLE